MGLLMGWLRTRNLQPSGRVAAAFFMIYGVIRISLEVFREPDLGDPLVAGLSRGQWFSMGLVVFGAGIWFFRGKRG